jgi:ABC-type uncharacterized transport system permease subunit
VTAAQVGDGTGNIWFALAIAGLAGAVFSAIHAFLSVTLRANQIVSGLALTIFGTGLAIFIGKSIEGEPIPTKFSAIRFGPLADIPVVGPILFEQDPIVYATIAAAVGIRFYLRNTRTGLSLRSVGESPATADSLGISVAATRYVHVILGGLFAGFAGGYLVLSRVNWAQDGTTAGIGWIALALVVFASWRPLRVLFGAFLFGFARNANFWLQRELSDTNFEVPPEFLSMLPYLLTIVVLVAMGSRDRRRVGAPAALGVPFVRDER